LCSKVVTFVISCLSLFLYVCVHTDKTPGRYIARKQVSSNLQVFVRVRPLLGSEKSELKEREIEYSPSEPCVECVDATQLVLTPPAIANANGDAHTLAFTRVFDTDAQQSDVYNVATAPMLKTFMEGQNGLIFGYGITNSGKTYTLQGGDTSASEGMIPRALRDMFDANHKALNKWSVTLSFCEIYNEQVCVCMCVCVAFGLLISLCGVISCIHVLSLTHTLHCFPQIYDLLADHKKKRAEKRTRLNLRQTVEGQVFIEGVTEVVASNISDAFALLKRAQAARQVCSV
jgi:hypothetical protein